MPDTEFEKNADVAADTNPGGVTVTGNGVASAAPDIARLQFAAESIEDDAQRAIAVATASLAEIRRTVLAAGVAERDLQSGTTSLWAEQVTPELTRFRGRFGLTVTVRDMSKAGDLLTAGLKAGGAQARLDGLSFAHDDPTALLDAARTAAFEDAQAKATQFAALAGRALGRVQQISESADYAIPRKARMFAEAAGSVDAGEQEVRASVTVSWVWQN